MLWVTDEVPDVRGTGGSVRQHHLLRAVAAQVPVTVVVAAARVPDELGRMAADLVVVPPPVPSPQAPRWRTWTLSLLDPAPEDVRNGRPGRGALTDAVLARLADHDTVVVQHAWLAPLAAERRAGQRWILDLHNLPSVRASHRHATATTWRARSWARAEVAKGRRAETRMVAAHDLVVVPSSEDRRALGDGSRVRVVPNGVDVDRYRPSPLPADPRVVFTGHLAYGPNVDAVTWFATHVWPRVRATAPEATWDIVGRGPAPEVQRLDGRDGIRVHADVPSTRPFLDGARVVVVPVRVGSGTRLKALEAMACGRPVVGTTVGLEGLAVEDEVQVLRRDSPQDMAAAVVDLLADDHRCRALGAAGRALVVDRFDWSEVGDRFAALVASSRRPPRP